MPLLNSGLEAAAWYLVPNRKAEEWNAQEKPRTRRRFSQMV